MTLWWKLRKCLKEFNGRKREKNERSQSDAEKRKPLPEVQILLCPPWIQIHRFSLLIILLAFFIVFGLLEHRTEWWQVSSWLDFRPLFLTGFPLGKPGETSAREIYIWQPWMLFSLHRDMDSTGLRALFLPIPSFSWLQSCHRAGTIPSTMNQIRSWYNNKRSWN